MIPDFGDLFRAMRQIEEQYRSLEPDISRALEAAPAIPRDVERAQSLVQEVSRQIAVANEFFSSTPWT